MADLILGVIYSTYNSIMSNIKELKSEIVVVDTKVERFRLELSTKMDAEIAGLRSEMNAGFERLDAKIDSRTDSLRSDLGGKIDANTDKLSELATEVQVHLRTHHLISEIERITATPESGAEEEQAVEETNQPS